MDADDLRTRLDHGLPRLTAKLGSGASVLVAVAPADGARSDGLDVILEVRAGTLATQPHEVCLPGGAIEPRESAREAAVREAAEELLVTPDQVRIIAELGEVPGPSGPLHAFVGLVGGYADTFGVAEVERTFRIPVGWFVAHEPTLYHVGLDRRFPRDFPWERIPGGRRYPWQDRADVIPFYDTDPVIWGATARVLHRFAQAIRLGEGLRASTQGPGQALAEPEERAPSYGPPRHAIR